MLLLGEVRLSHGVMMLANNNKTPHFVGVAYVINRMHPNGWDVPKW